MFTCLLSFNLRKKPDRTTAKQINYGQEDLAALPPRENTGYNHDGSTFDMYPRYVTQNVYIESTTNDDNASKPESSDIEIDKVFDKFLCK